VLTESNDSITANHDTLNSSIKAFSFQSEQTGLVKNWEINDFTKKQANDRGFESSIWFWTKYSEFTDLDNDSLMDPILVYGTSGTNGYDDGRIKILVYNKGQKIAIRNQNGILDFERNTQVDKTFYSLPMEFQDRVKEIMETMVENNHAIFPAGWQDAMNKQQLTFDEN